MVDNRKEAKRYAIEHLALLDWNNIFDCPQLLFELLKVGADVALAMVRSEIHFGFRNHQLNQ